jgi:hypothetical protein
MQRQSPDCSTSCGLDSKSADGRQRPTLLFCVGISRAGGRPTEITSKSSIAVIVDPGPQAASSAVRQGPTSAGMVYRRYL